MPLDKIYTFYINGVEPDEGIWGCVAKSLEEATAKAINAGLKDFFLNAVTDVPDESLYENSLDTFLENPNLGPAWLPMAKAFDLASRRLTSSSEVWVVDTLLKSNDYSPENTPYCQAILENSGELHLEVAGRLALSDLSHEDLRVLEFIGWQVPDLDKNETEKAEGLPNPYRIFDIGWGSFQVASFALETMVTVYGFRETDYFDFTSRSLSKEIAALGTLERAEIHSANPDGTLFRLFQSDGS